MTEDDEARLKWLKANPMKTYNDLPQNLWDDSRVAMEGARQEIGLRFGHQLQPGPAQQPWPPIPFTGGWR